MLSCFVQFQSHSRPGNFSADMAEVDWIQCVSDFLGDNCLPISDNFWLATNLLPLGKTSSKLLGLDVMAIIELLSQAKQDPCHLKAPNVEFKPFHQKTFFLF